MQGTARRKGLKGKPALPTASKTLAIWTPARPPPARHVPGAATRRGAREADGTEQTATVHSGGGWEAQGAAPGLTWTVSCARSSACSLSASCRRMAAASPPAAGAQCRRLSLPLGRKPNARPASSPCAALSRPTEQPRVPRSSCARSAPLHPRAGVRPPAGTPRNTTSSTHPTAGGVSCVQPPPALLTFEQPVKHSGYNRTVCLEGSCRHLRAPQRFGDDRKLWRTLSKCCVCTAMGLGHQPPLWEARSTPGPRSQ